MKALRFRCVAKEKRNIQIYTKQQRLKSVYVLEERNENQIRFLFGTCVVQPTVFVVANIKRTLKILRVAVLDAGEHGARIELVRRRTIDAIGLVRRRRPDLIVHVSDRGSFQFFFLFKPPSQSQASAGRDQNTEASPHCPRFGRSTIESTSLRFILLEAKATARKTKRKKKLAAPDKFS